MARIAWFSPLPPIKSGIAKYCTELLPGLAVEHHLDLFVDPHPAMFEAPQEHIQRFDAHNFIWKDRAQPYELIVYQLGNAPCHDYMWAYMINYPGVVVLHDGQLHHARGRMLLQQKRADHYRQEFWFNHPDADKDLPELGAAGLMTSLTYLWPMLRVAVETSRMVVVHNTWLAEQIREAHRGVSVNVVNMGVPGTAPGPDARRRIRSRHGIPDEAIVFVCFGNITPEKRVREAMRALSAIADDTPDAHLLLAGAPVDYYDMAHESRSLRIDTRVTIAGYIDDAEIDDYLAAADVALCMRWPTSRETSASWLRCLAAAKPTISTDLVHTVEVPTLDPRNWALVVAPAIDSDASRGGQVSEADAIGVSIDILDELHSLKLAMRRLAMDQQLRSALGANAQALWARAFRLETMVEGYQRVIAEALRSQPGHAAARAHLPAHLRATGVEHAESLVREIVGPEYHFRDAD